MLIDVSDPETAATYFIDVSDPETAATYFIDVYAWDYWDKA